MPNPQPGTILGAYRVEGTIGSGSMGEVFKAIDTGLNRRVAIKILSEKHRDSQELRQRFIREGRAVAAISHPNVVQVFATGQFDDRPYIAMELLDGTDLGSVVEKRGPLDSLSATHVVLDAAQGLAAAAKAGLIHRDVKPSNLVRLSDGKVKVTDFGLAKPVDPGTEPALTAMGVVVGTPDYIAPEQARGETIDERVDIYALGGTLYFLLTGMPPFRTGKPSEDKYLKVVARHLRNPPPDATQTNSAVDRELADLARLMMAKKSSERPAYDDLVSRLTQILARVDPDAVPQLIQATRERSRPNLAIPSALNRSPSMDDSKTIAGSADLSRPPLGAVPGWVILFTLVCVGLFVAGLVVYLNKSDAAPPAHTEVAVPPNAIAVTLPGGKRLAVDKAPVTLDAFHQMFKQHAQTGPAASAVLGVSYTEARSYAQTHGGRLLTSDEWDAASTQEGFTLVPDVYEWVESPDEKARVVRQLKKTQTRPDKEQPDITFRMAKDL